MVFGIGAKRQSSQKLYLLFLSDLKCCSQKLKDFSSQCHINLNEKSKTTDLNALCLERLSKLVLDGHKMPLPPELW